MATSTSATHIPRMDWTNEDLAEALSLFKQKIQLYVDDQNVTDKVAQARKISIGVGDEGLKRLNASGLTDDDRKDPAKLWTFFEKQLKVNVNFRIHRLQLMKFTLKKDESVDDFVSRARTLALKCQFTDDELTERIIELLIANTPHELFRNWLYSKAIGTKLDDVLEEGRKYEAVAAGNTQLTQLGYKSKQESVNAVTHQRKCRNCDTIHKPRQCPAYYDECLGCGAKGHWKVCCRKSKRNRSQSRRRDDRREDRREDRRGQGQRRGNQSRGRGKSKRGSRGDSQVDVVEYDASYEENAYQKEFYAITVGNHVDNMSIDTMRKEAFVSLKIKIPELSDSGNEWKKGDHSLRLKIDTGAAGNTLPLRTFHQMYGKSQKAIENLKTAVHVKLTSYSGNVIPCLGILDILCQHKNQSWRPAKFFVVDVEGPPILGLPTSEELGIVSIHIDNVCKSVSPKQETNIQSVSQLKNMYPEQFDKIGNFKGPVKLHLKEDAEPFIDAPRKCSIHLKDKLKLELEKLVEASVLRKVTEHTDWCSSLAFSVKKDNSLRICLDPQKLNENLKRCPHKIPTVEELNPMFAGAKFFSKLDAKAGYWAIHLDEQSQLLTTFRTPFGRYCWRRLPFGLKVSQDIFQSRMDEILEGLSGVVSIADDIAIIGRTEAEHDQNLHALMRRASEQGLVFNSQKCLIKVQQISFFGNLYTSNGVQPDPAKVKDIHNMPEPQSKDDVQRFMGMLTYLAPYIPKLAESAYVIRDLLKKEVPFTWDADHKKCFEKLKSMITVDACLQYYDAQETLTLEVDASQKGLGAALTQNNKPVAFGSKTLTECQSRYSNIEREMLAIVYGIQRYHTYLYGKPFIVVTDHKPLVAICTKPLHAAPPRLQRMLLKIQGYQYTVVYRPGPEMVMADVLSRLPNPSNNKPVDLDERVDLMQLDDDILDDIDISLINFSAEKQRQLRIETARDPVLSLVKDIITKGWPEKIKDLHESIRPYWFFRDDLAIESGVIIKGRQVVIPDSMTKDIMQQLHSGHQGIEKTRRLARESVYWPNINKDIENLCKTCEACQLRQTANPKQPLQPHAIPVKPWQMIASDLFDAHGRQFLLTVDRYSKFPIVEELPSPTSKAVAEKMKFYSSMFGRPEEIMTDNGPQYTGQAFQKFIQEWSICHVTSSPHYPQSNGFIERHVRTIKAIVLKCLEEGEDMHKAILNLRATPVDSTLPSPAEMMFGKPIATLLPSRTEPGKDIHREQLENRCNQMTNNAKSTLKALRPGQQVRIRNPNSQLWQPGFVLKAMDNDDYIVETWNGAMLRRTRSHIRESENTPNKQVRFSQPPNPPPNVQPTARQPVQCEQPPPANENRPVTEKTVRRSGREIKKPKRYEN